MTMIKKIVAIGGGDVGRIKIMPDGTEKNIPNETIFIDKELIRLSGKETPKLLFIGAAQDDNPVYYENVRKHFVNNLNCEVSALNIVSENLNPNQIKAAILDTDIIYIGGGDTRHLIDVLNSSGALEALKKAYDSGIVIAGMSAGAICWFDWYDNEEYIDGDNTKLDVLPGFGYIKGFCVPHWNTKNDEEKQIMRDMLITKGIQGIALDNGTAVASEDGALRIIRSLPDASVESL
jgi:dipeptidase E